MAELLHVAVLLLLAGAGFYVWRGEVKSDRDSRDIRREIEDWQRRCGR